MLDVSRINRRFLAAPASASPIPAKQLVESDGRHDRLRQRCWAEGSRFWFEIRLPRGIQCGCGQSRSYVCLSAPIAPQRARDVLIAEDNKVNQSRSRG